VKVKEWFIVDVSIFDGDIDMETPQAVESKKLM
jgi:hypothetical protein